MTQKYIETQNSLVTEIVSHSVPVHYRSYDRPRAKQSLSISVNVYYHSPRLQIYTVNHKKRDMAEPGR